MRFQCLMYVLLAGLAYGQAPHPLRHPPPEQ